MTNHSYRPSYRPTDAEKEQNARIRRARANARRAAKRRALKGNAK